MNKYKKPLYETEEVKNIKELFKRSSVKYSNEKAFLVKVGGQYMPITYKQFYDDIMAFGAALYDMGLYNTHIAVIGENRYEWAVTYAAVQCGLGVIVPLDKEMPDKDIPPLIETAELSALISSQKKSSLAESAQIKHKINMDTDFNELIKKGKALIETSKTPFPDLEPDADKMSILLFTSGTTSASKAVMLSQKNIITNIIDMSKMVHVDKNDTLLSVLPLHHTYECTCGFLTPVYQGCTVAYCEGLRHITKNLAEAQATIMLCVPLLVENVYKKIWQQARKNGKEKDLKTALKISNFLLKFHIDLRKKLFADIHKTLGGKLTRIISGAAGIDPEIARGMRAFGINLIQGYGLTECSPICTVNRFEEYKDDAAGLPMPNVEVWINNPSDDGIGEIAVKGNNVMLGYYKNKEETDKVLLPDGTFLTGDLGFIDSDGYLHITGRKKNVIVTKNGKNIFPEELETYLLRSPYIQECMVYGTDTSDGDTDVAVQVLPNMQEAEKHFGRIPSPDDLQALIENEVMAVNHKMQNYKRIGRTIIRHEEFAKTTTQKIKRHVEIKKGESV